MRYLTLTIAKQEAFKCSKHHSSDDSNDIDANDKAFKRIWNVEPLAGKESILFIISL